MYVRQCVCDDVHHGARDGVCAMVRARWCARLKALSSSHLCMCTCGVVRLATRMPQNLSRSACANPGRVKRTDTRAWMKGRHQPCCSLYFSTRQKKERLGSLLSLHTPSLFQFTKKARFGPSPAHTLRLPLLHPFLLHTNTTHLPHALCSATSEPSPLPHALCSATPEPLQYDGELWLRAVLPGMAGQRPNVRCPAGAGGV
eukprot:364848-Chlamydomonas_euryale.AAC.1